MLKYKGYSGKYQLEDGIFVGKVDNIDSKTIILFESKTEKELKKEFETSVDSYLNSCITWGDKPQPPNDESTISWTFPAKLNQQIIEKSKENSIPPQQFIQEIIETGLRRL
jgi:predicted HicB family RNase H-like nuclease